MSVIVLDTDVASALLRKRATEALAGHLAGQIPDVTFVTVGELTTWTLVRRWARAAWPRCRSSSTAW